MLNRVLIIEGMKTRRSRQQYIKDARANPQHAMPCETPLGRFESATKAAEAHGFSKAYISRLCKAETYDVDSGKVWRYL